MSDLLYTLNADDLFYEAPENYRTTDDSVSSILRDFLPPDWKLRHHGIWLIAEPPVQNLPKSGFKIHVSTRPEYRERVIRTCTQTSAEFNASIKSYCDLNIWTRLQDKPYAAEFPLNYGKAITIYPETTEIFFQIARKLAAEFQLQGFSGPDIITDTPVLNSTNVYYRYGAFLAPDDDSEEIDDDDRYGSFLAPDDDSEEIDDDDDRIPKLPKLTSPLTDDRPPHPIDEFKVQYAIQNAGIYVAEKDGETVVIKEAAEDECVDADGKDAVARLLSELAILHALSDANADIAPKPIQSFKIWRNRYVVMQHLQGFPISELSKKPIALPTRIQIAAGVADALAQLHDEHRIVWGDVSPANVLWHESNKKIHFVDFEHARKLTQKPQKPQTTPAGTPGFTATRPKKSYTDPPSFRLRSLLWIDRQSDVHPSGFYHLALRLLLWSFYTVFYPIETYHRGRQLPFWILSAICSSRDSGSPLRVVMRHLKTLNSDVRGLGLVLSFIFAPVNPMFDLDPTAPRRFLKAMEAHFPKKLITVIENCLSPELTHTTAKSVADTLREIQAQGIPTTEASEKVEEIPISTYRKTLNDIIAFIKAHLTFDRQDRLIPCPPDGFFLPLSIAYGGSGLANFLKTIGEETLAEKTLDWIRDHPDFSDEQKLTATPGYWAGTAGLANTLGRFGETDAARKCIEIAAKHTHNNTDEFHRYDGIAGVAHAALTLYNDTNNDFYISTAKDLADQLIAQAVEADADDTTRIWKSPDDDTIYTGYLFGVAGAAAFLFQLADQLKVNQQHYTDIAEQALFWVENQSIVAEDGCIATPITAGGDTTYARNLAHGNAGIAKSFLLARQHFGEDKDDFIRQLLLPNDTHTPEPAFAHTPAPGYFYGLSGIGEVLLDAFAITGETDYLSHAHSILKNLLCFQVTDPHGKGVGFPGGENIKRLSCDFATGSLGVADFIYHFLKAADSHIPYQRIGPKSP